MFKSNMKSTKIDANSNPTTGEFLQVFDLVAGTQIGDYSIISVNANRKTLKKGEEYEYKIEVTLASLLGSDINTVKEDIRHISGVKNYRRKNSYKYALQLEKIMEMQDTLILYIYGKAIKE